MLGAVLSSLLAVATPAVANPVINTRALGQNGMFLAEVAQRKPSMAFSLSGLFDSNTEYAPTEVDCPSEVTWIRPAGDGLSPNETTFLSTRQTIIGAAFQQQLAAVNITAPARTPVIGMALSGGGYRAMINGLGGVLDLMNTSAVTTNTGVGGWFDATTYMAGLSGGSWGTGSFMANGGMSPYDLITTVWNLQSNLIFPDDDKVNFYTDLVREVNAKSDEDFPTQITDYWALALGEHLLPTEYRLATHPTLTISQLTTVVPALQNASLPWPIIIAAEREADEIVVPENATLWEFTPSDFGSWTLGSQNKYPGAFTPVEYLGSSLDNGAPNGTCYTGFDRLSFVMGTSSTLFNGALLELNGTGSDSIIIDALEAVLGAIGEDDNDVSRIPNFLANWNTTYNPIATNEYITLVDAGETNQNIPLEPLLVPQRQVDAIIAFDSSADTTYSWPNGSAMRTTYERSLQFANVTGVDLRMPAVPSTNGFVNGGLNTRPVFFGCNETDTPLIVYVPNYPWRTASNTSTYMLSYENATTEAVMLNGASALDLNGTVANWPTCLACAFTDRANGYTASNRSSECAQCFSTWCWNGEDNTTQPAEYEPVVGQVPSFLAGLTA